MKKALTVIIASVVTLLTIFAVWMFRSGVISEASLGRFGASKTSGIVSALEKSNGSLSIPAGDYDFEGRTVTLDRFVSINGAGKESTIVRNLTIVAPYGISIDGISFYGGANNNLKGTATTFNGTAAIVIVPANSEVRVIYNNTDFYNATVASFVCGDNTVAEATVNNCTFKDIERVALYFSVNSKKTTITNSNFLEIGNSSITTGRVSAIWVGDVTNNLNYESEDLTIYKNTLNNLYTGDDPSFTSHIINANFISARAKKAVINENVISGVHGYGEDRESLYTKVRYLTVTNNTITNGGYGEGYITCKGQDGSDAETIISGNHLYGDYGNGIYLYEAGKIFDNEIRITNSKAPIVCYSRDATDKKLEILENTIEFTPSSYMKSGVKNPEDVVKSAICVMNKKSAVEVLNNTIVAHTSSEKLQGGIEVNCFSQNVTVTGNNVVLDQNAGNGVYIHSNETYSSGNKDSEIRVSNNVVQCKGTGVAIVLKNENSVETSRKYYVEGNKLDCAVETSYGVYVDGGGNNSDSLVYSYDSTAASDSIQVFTNAKAISGETSKINQEK